MNKKSKSFMKLFFVIMWFLLIYFGVIFIWSPRIGRIIGPSMFPTVISGDMCLTIGNFNKINRRDIVIIDTSYRKLIKRVVGIPGDFIAIINGMLFVNGEREDTDGLLYRFTYMPGENLKNNNLFMLSLGKDEYFVLGDNRVMSGDSRHFGVVNLKNIKEKAIFKWRSFGVNND